MQFCKEARPLLSGDGRIRGERTAQIAGADAGFANHQALGECPLLPIGAADGVSRAVEWVPVQLAHTLIDVGDSGQNKHGTAGAVGL